MGVVGVVGVRFVGFCLIVVLLELIFRTSGERVQKSDFKREKKKS